MNSRYYLLPNPNCSINSYKHYAVIWMTVIFEQISCTLGQYIIVHRNNVNSGTVRKKCL